jgi:hypothetical protein
VTAEYPFPRAWSAEEPDDPADTMARFHDQATGRVPGPWVNYYARLAVEKMRASLHVDATQPVDEPTVTAAAIGWAPPILEIPWPAVPRPPRPPDPRRRTAGFLQVFACCFGVVGVGRLMIGSPVGWVQVGAYLFGATTLILGVGLPIMLGAWLWSLVDGLVLLAGES